MFCALKPNMLGYGFGFTRGKSKFSTEVFVIGFIEMPMGRVSVKYHTKSELLVHQLDNFAVI